MTDNTELKRLAEAATPGRNFDRLPEAGGGLKYECTGDDGSLVLKVDHKNDEWGFVGDKGQADEKFFLACTPSAVLALIAENERLERKNANQSESIREYQDLVMGGGVSLGMLKADIRVTTGERDQLRAEIAGLKTGYEAYERVNAELKAENERLRYQIGVLQSDANSWQSGYDVGRHMGTKTVWAERRAVRKDAERYRWLRDSSQYDWDVSYGKLELRIETPHDDSSDLDACIDAALGKGEQA